MEIIFSQTLSRKRDFMGSPFSMSTSGSFKNTYQFLTKLENGDFYKILDHYGQVGVESLRDHTPVDTGRAADSWYYEIDIGPNESSITWCNKDVENGMNVILLLEYGHGTKSGGYVDGIEIIEPSLRPVINSMIDAIWREVERS